MAVSRIEILSKNLSTQNKNLLFILNRNLLMPTKVGEVCYSLAKGSSSEVLELDFEGNLYDALKGYLLEENIELKEHGDISTKYLVRIDKPEDQKTVRDFASEFKKYKELNSRIHSISEEQKIDDYKKWLAGF